MRTQSISAMDARKKFGEMLNRVSLRQEEIIIERAGKKIARLSPVEQPAQQQSGKMDFRKAAGLGHEVWKDVDVDEYIDQERAEWD